MEGGGEGVLWRELDLAGKYFDLRCLSGLWMTANWSVEFNPTWQVTSKALVDYFNRPKMAYFTVKRDIAPLSLGIERKEIKKPRFEFTRAFIDTETRFLGWATNVTLEPVICSLVIKLFELSTGTEVFSRVETKEMAANISTELFDLELPKAQTSADEPIIISTCLRTLPIDGKEGVCLRDVRIGPSRTGT